jgi:hypothetical protein
MFITNDTAANDTACQMAMAAYAARLQREHEQREAIRRGDFIPVPTTTWNISDRD